MATIDVETPEDDPWAQHEMEAEHEAKERTEFHITDERSANWLLRQLGNLDAELKRVKAQKAEIVKSLQSQRERLLYLYGAELEVWARQRLSEQGGRSKTLRLLQGTCGFRSVPPTLKIVDEAAAFRHATVTGLREAFQFHPEGYLAKVKEIGELLPGVEMSEPRESFSIRFASSEKDEAE